VVRGFAVAVGKFSAVPALAHGPHSNKQVNRMDSN